MAVKIADACVHIMLCTDQLDRDIATVEAKIKAIGDKCIPICIDTSQAEAQIAALQAQAQATVQVAQGNVAAAQSAQTSQATAQPRSQPSRTSAESGSMADNVRTARAFSKSMNPIAAAYGPWEEQNWLERQFSGTAESLGLIFSFGASAAATRAAPAAAAVGASLVEGVNRGMVDRFANLETSMAEGVDQAINAGKKAAEVESPSRRAAREIGSPIMQGVAMGIAGGTLGVVNAMINSIGFSFNTWKNVLFGYGGNMPGLSIVDGGGGFGGWLGALGGAFNMENSIGGTPDGPFMASRMLLGQFPMQIRNFGQSLLSGALESFLPGWASGPLADMIGTAIGTKPILLPGQALGEGKFADQGGFGDYPFRSGFVMNVNNTFPPGLTDVERDVQMGVLRAMRRLGVY